MIEALLKFNGNKIFCNGFEITQSMYGWHVLNVDGELEIGVSDIEDAVSFCLKKGKSNESKP